MKIIFPPHLKISQKVEDYKGIIPEAISIIKSIKNGDFITPGSSYHDCYAIAQPQVSFVPRRYFVINPEHAARIALEMEGLVIINPRILSKNKNSKVQFKDACMSYPFRPPKKVKRYNQIKVTYQYISDLKNPHLSTMHEKGLVGLSAMIFQHELEHLNGKSIWFN